MKTIEAKGKQMTPEREKKSYQKPTWERQEMFERFALACSKITSQQAGCIIPFKNS